MKKLYFLLVGLLLYTCVFSQTAITIPPIPQMRQLFHDKIIASQKAIIQLNNKRDTIFTATNDLDVNLQIHQILKVRINNMRAEIEMDSAIDVSGKYTWLRGIDDMLTDFKNGYQSKLIKGILLSDLIIAFDEAMQAELHHQSIFPIVQQNEMEVGNILIRNFGLQNNKGIPAAKEALVLKLCQRNQPNILKILSQYPNVSFADSLIIVMAHRNPDKFYDYASAPDSLGKRIQTVNEPLVKTISQMAGMKTGRVFFPFLDNIYHHKISIDSIEKISADSNAYYKLLVRTEIDYATRAKNGDTPIVMHVLTEKLKRKAVEIYIDQINALHEEKSDAVRFKCLDSLTAVELYYLCVLAEDEIYTSSYLGVYKRIFQRMGVERSDTLLNWVQYDFYKKFIKMAAAYNVLDDFLKKMNQTTAVELMKNFANGLEKDNTLEEAVDVADSYASIDDAAIKKLILAEVQKNIKLFEQAKNTRASVIYHLLNTIFLSDDSTNKTDVSSKLGIPPVYVMPNKLLQDSSGKIIVQQFFYGDKDGLAVFNSFIANYRNALWKIVNKPEWIEVSSVKGTKITIYCNRPFDTKQDLDQQAQDDLATYLDSIGTSPTVVIQRGHSYYVNQTIKQLPYTSKVVMLGACGGYQNLNAILNICPDAHIISTKQTGTGIVNIALINSIAENLRLGKDLNWQLMWKHLENKFTAQYKEKFDDYVPPYKNLGAIFIMAYKRAMEKE
jgi:hypothetical protein